LNAALVAAIGRRSPETFHLCRELIGEIGALLRDSHESVAKRIAVHSLRRFPEPIFAVAAGGDQVCECLHNVLHG
jgi:hypothetical protein